MNPETPEFKKLANDLHTAAEDVAKKTAKAELKPLPNPQSSQDVIRDAHAVIMRTPPDSPESLQAWEDILDALVGH